MKKLFFCLFVFLGISAQASYAQTWTEVRTPGTCGTASNFPCPTVISGGNYNAIGSSPTPYAVPAALSNQQPMWFDYVDGIFIDYMADANCGECEWGNAVFGYKDCALSVTPLSSCSNGDNGTATTGIKTGWMVLNDSLNIQINGNGGITPGECSGSCTFTGSGTTVTVALPNTSARFINPSCPSNPIVNGCYFQVNLTGAGFSTPTAGTPVTCTSTITTTPATPGEPLCNAFTYTATGSGLSGTTTCLSSAASCITGPSETPTQPYRRHSEGSAYDSIRNYYWLMTGEGDVDSEQCLTSGSGPACNGVGIISNHTGTDDLYALVPGTQSGQTCGAGQICKTWQPFCGFTTNNFCTSTGSPAGSTNVTTPSPAGTSPALWGIPCSTGAQIQCGYKFPYMIHEPVNDVIVVFGGQWNSGIQKETLLYYPLRTVDHLGNTLSSSLPNDPVGCVRPCWVGLGASALSPSARWAQGDSRMPALGTRGEVFLTGGSIGAGPCSTVACLNDSWILNLNSQTPFWTQINPNATVTGVASATGSTVTLNLSATCPFINGDVVAISGISPSGYNNLTGVAVTCSGSTLSYANATTASYVSGGYVGCNGACDQPTNPPPNMNPVVDYAGAIFNGAGGVVEIDNQGSSGASPGVCNTAHWPAAACAHTWFFNPANNQWQDMNYLGSPALNQGTGPSGYTYSGAIDSNTNQFMVLSKQDGTAYADLWYLSLPGPPSFAGQSGACVSSTSSCTIGSFPRGSTGGCLTGPTSCSFALNVTAGQFAVCGVASNSVPNTLSCTDSDGDSLTNQPSGSPYTNTGAGTIAGLFEGTIGTTNSAETFTCHVTNRANSSPGNSLDGMACVVAIYSGTPTTGWDVAAAGSSQNPISYGYGVSDTLNSGTTTATTAPSELAIGLFFNTCCGGGWTATDGWNPRAVMSSDFGMVLVDKILTTTGSQTAQVSLSPVGSGSNAMGIVSTIK
jgi:hypothetical protein